MIIEQSQDGSITVLEALPTELIDAEIFEAAHPRWLQIWNVSETDEGVSGSFRIAASNGEWTYRLRRRCPWLGRAFEADLALGEPVHKQSAMTVGEARHG